MRKVVQLLVLVLSLSVVKAWGQNYIPYVQEGAWWSVTVESVSGTNTGIFIISGNATIDGVDYKNFDCFLNPPACIPCNNDWLIREDTAEKKVYFKEDPAAEEIIFYDFSLTPGDSIPFDWYPTHYFETVSSVVDTVYYKQLFGFDRKVISFIPLDVSPANFGCTEIIEGFGLPDHPYPYSALCRAISPEGTNQIDTFGVNPSISCEDLILSNSLLPNQQSFKVFPTLAESSIMIEVPAILGEEKVDFYSISGKLIFSTALSNILTEIDVSFMPDGIYFLRFFSPSQKSSIQKIVIHH
ncbi:MAG: T9SS type A sorting domain-containing protein [Bacteroidota bacterium]